MYIAIVEFNDITNDLGNCHEDFHIIYEENYEDAITMLRDRIFEDYQEEIAFGLNLGIEKILLYKVSAVEEIPVSEWIDAIKKLKN